MAPRSISYDEEFSQLPAALRPILTFLVTPLVDPRKQKESFLANPFSFLFSKKKTQTKAYVSFKDFNDIPIEFLAMICIYLEPSEIFALAGVCRNLRTLLLDIESAAVQEIWRSSRLEFCPFLQLPPPKGMREQEFIALTSLERGCQFCGQRKQWVSIYWRYRVRSCYDCFVPRFVRNSFLNRRPINYHKSHDTLEELKKREYNDSRRLEFNIDFRKRRLQEIMEELEEERKESDNESINSGASPKYDPQILRKCPAYNDEWKMLYQPFTRRDEARLRKKLDYEYAILSKHYVS